ncbi:diguanylate cyclase (GGDEF) domain-containing protein [Herbaspirillum sp. CF444]|uniref:putative bifunctional diguanylate cyclase/phosphodiesterase n=1 Tax=Herbaspirillum sp. CF444 TaxID=1144319 RepID=UPI0002724586|nr:EAL domain-containing protein [Herbaspirillum sp. CF444]EJL94332.1 diguanylate cyclase (GGDEF) domain-containing protein [Herbaspirillum sp. CF444]
MRWHRLENRIVALFIVLILLVQLAGFVAIRKAIDENARASIRDELIIGERVFLRLLEQNADKLTQGARLLASDFGFRQAIGTDDRGTITSVLENHGARIGSTLSMLIGTDQKIKASTQDHPSADLQRSSLELVAKAAETNGASDTVIVDDSLFQIVAVPVRAPVTIGWVVMGFPVDQKLISDMRALSSLQLSVMVSTRDGQWQQDVSTLPKEEAGMLLGQLPQQLSASSFIPQLKIGDNDYSARLLVLAKGASNQSAVAVLQRSISEAVAPYRRLQLILLTISVIGVAMAIFASAFVARRITSPLRSLADIAKRLGAGDYRARIDIKGGDEIGKLAEAFESMRTGIANRELEIRRLAYWDPLTDLPNRVQFATLLNAAIERAKASHGQCHILMMDLDRFQHVNDVLGHSFGDSLLREVGRRLELQLERENDKVARLGGDEYAILLPATDATEAIRQAKRILHSLEMPISIGDQTVDLGAGIGIAGYPENGQDSDTLLSSAEVAMYVAKRRGSGFTLYDPSIDKSSQESLSLLSELRRALDRNEFLLYAQPKVELATGKVVGAEALVRWVHPEKGFIGPDNFIPFAETTGFIRMLTSWMLNKAAVLCAELQKKGITLKFSVNLSTRDLLDQDLPMLFADILARNQLSPSSMCLEITESAIMDDPIRAQLTLERLHGMGVELAIDDFGTGYSSLAYLKRLPVDELKIDKSFVMNMEHDADDAKIVKSTIDLGHNLGLRVVAEGLETLAVWNLLKQMGCDQAQGYYMSKPMPGDRFAEWLEQWKAPEMPGQSENVAI